MFIRIIEIENTIKWLKKALNTSYHYNDNMNLDIINPHTLRILISCRGVDSIRAISNRINLSYGWTYKWVQELTNKGVFTLTRMNIYLNKDNEFYKKTLSFIKKIFKKSPSYYYEALSLLGIQYCFTNIDSVYVWTKGGYNISRYKEHYPIFIKLKIKDKKLFEWYCKKLNLNINKKKGVFYNVTYLENFNIDYVEKIPVDGLNDTINFMEKHKYNFEPALEMIKELYNQRIEVKYKEAITNV